jgi:hypothetical protein
MTPQNQLFFDKSFQFFRESRDGEYLTTHTTKLWHKMFINLKIL